MERINELISDYTESIYLKNRMSTGCLLNKSVLIDLIKLIHHDNDLFEYYKNHVKLMALYAHTLNHKLDLGLDPIKLAYIAMAHDLFKERSLNKEKEFIEYNGLQVPHDLNKYVRNNLDILDIYNMGDFFNTDVGLHPLTASIFLHKEFHLRDPEIIYPIMFHSCPIVSVYKTLSPTIQTMIDIIMLSDKLSSNHLRINTKNTKVNVDLDLLVFGESGNEISYILGLYIARLIAQGKSTESQSILSTKYYNDRLLNQNLFISNIFDFSKMGGKRIWPKRKSIVLMTQPSYSGMF